ncbi:hypothetical protein PRIPAC_76602 [Pristionchus pacificus]|uniref:G protein-coupled receptor n=1 Tax=Pristionchus pacificus TaxID=54126 RepID=A0A2A6CSU6_PRIPA|nr:hypothetical protein PRIPAC_76602 [Pristionchus pacificus]|eukprot:PDM81292.1 G protein-coupled receptor [Pristionchus pacificus]
MDDDCIFSNELHNSVLLQSVRCIQIFITFSTIIVVFFASKNLSRTIFSSVTIMFIKILFTVIVIYSIGYGINQMIHVIVRNISTTPCNSEFPKFLCLFRAFSSIIGPCFVLIHTSIIIQQAMSSFRHPLRIQKGVARLTLFITVCYVTFFGILSLTNELFTGFTPVCSSSKSIEIVAIGNLNLMMIMNLFNTISAILLLRRNKKILLNEYTNSPYHSTQSLISLISAPKNPRPKGWALRSTKKTGRYDPVARKLVDDLFEQYFSNGKKLRPDEDEKRMRERNDILPAQRMTFDQIRNRITTLLSQKKEHQRKEHGNRQRRYVKLIDDFERDLAEEGISLDDIEEEIAPFYCFFSPLTFLILTKLGPFRRMDHVKNITAHNSKAQDMTDDCTLSTELYDSILLQSVRWIQITVTLSSILITIYTSFLHLSRTIFDSFTIWFIKILFSVIVVYSFGLGLTQVAHVTARNTATTPCDAEIPKEICLFRMLAASVTPAFVLIHVSITIQQCLSTFRYSVRVQNSVSRLTLCVTSCYILLFGFMAYRNETLVGKTQFCTSFNQNSEIFIIANMNVMMILDITNSFCAILLLRYNKKLLSKDRNSFELTRTFQRVQNLYAMEQFIIIIALHSISHFVHFSLYSFSFYYRPNYTKSQFTLLYAVVNIMPYYCLLSPLAFLILTKLGRFRRKDHVRNMIAPEHNTKAQDPIA